MTDESRSLDDVAWVDKISTPKLADIKDELRAAIAANVGQAEQRLSWSMISDHLLACQVYVSSSEILIRPLIPPTWTHAPFANATQRVNRVPTPIGELSY
jgi:hypothetical protein